MSRFTSSKWITLIKRHVTHKIKIKVANFLCLIKKYLQITGSFNVSERNKEWQNDKIMLSHGNERCRWHKHPICHLPSFFNHLSYIASTTFHIPIWSKKICCFKYFTPLFYCFKGNNWYVFAKKIFNTQNTCSVKITVLVLVHFLPP